MFFKKIINYLQILTKISKKYQKTFFGCYILLQIA